MKNLLFLSLISLVSCTQIKEEYPSDRFGFLDQVKVIRGFYIGYCGKVIRHNDRWFVDVNIFADGIWQKVTVEANDLSLVSDDRGCKE